MGVFDPELVEQLDGRRLGMVRVWVGMCGAVPSWEIGDDGTLCLTWERGERAVVMLIRPDSKTVMYRGRRRVPNAGGVALVEAVRWLRGMPVETRLTA